MLKCDEKKVHQEYNFKKVELSDGFYKMIRSFVPSGLLNFKIASGL